MFLTSKTSIDQENTTENAHVTLRQRQVLTKKTLQKMPM